MHPLQNSGGGTLDFLMKLLIVIGLGSIELWAAIPAGLAMGLRPVEVGITAACGASLGSLIVFYAGNRMKPWLSRWRSRNETFKQQSRVATIIHRYGVVGLGLLAPLLTGAPLAVAAGLAFGMPNGRMLGWIFSGIILWSVALTVTSALGVAGIESLCRRDF